MNTHTKLTAITAIFSLLFFATLALGATLQISIGDYDTTAYVNTEFSVPVTITSSNVTGTVTVTLNPSSGLSVTGSPATLTFSSSGSKTATFTMQGDTTGSYTSPFTVSAQGGSTTATPTTASSTLTVSEKPTITKTFTSGGLTTRTVTQGSTYPLVLDVTVTDTVEGAVATLILPTGYTLASGSTTYTMGTITGTKTAQWQVTATSPGTSSTVRATFTATSPVTSTSNSLIMGTTPDADCVDADGDGYNKIDSGCSGSNDCNDNNAAVSPGATEVASNRVDDDCDGSTDESATTTDSGTGGGGGGGGGGAGGATTTTPSLPQQTRAFGILAAGITVTMQVTNTAIPISEVAITTSKVATGAQLTVTALNDKPTAIPTLTKPFKYLNFSAQGLTADNVANATVTFTVNKSWLSAQGIAAEDVRLYRYTTQWTELPTTQATSSATTITYKATTPGFSYFAIAAKQPTTPTTTKTTENVTTTTTPGQQTPDEQGATAATRDLKTAIIVLIIVIVLIIAAVYIAIVHKRKQEKKPSRNM